MEWEYDKPLAVADALGESPKQHELFITYYEMGLDRSIPKLALKVGKKPAYAQYLNGLSTRYCWWDRIKRAQELEIAARQVAERELWLSRRAEMRDKLHDLADKMTQRATEMLEAAWYADEPIREKKFIKDGQTIIERTVIRKPIRWSAADAAKFGTVAAQLAKLATGLSDAPAVNLNFTPEDIAKMDDKELDETIERLKQAG